MINCHWLRRALLFVPFLVCAAVVSTACASQRAEAPGPTSASANQLTSAPSDPLSVAAENARPGTENWRILYPALDGEIAGYAGATSYDRGATVDLHVSTRTDGAIYSIELYRMGWYAGAGARLITDVRGQRGRAQGFWSPSEGLHDCKRCRFDAANGLLDTNWETSYRLRLNPSWPSGFYLVKLQLAEGKQTYVPFVVRDDRRKAGLLVQLSVNTWQAYNAWGDRSLYGAFDASRTWVGKTARAYKVSFNRPYDPMENGIAAFGAGEFFRFEYDFVRWVESQGYDVTYATDVDLHAGPGLLDARRGFVSVGHDEYWSWEQRAQVAAARDRGVGLAFLGGNDVYWQVRLEAGADGAADRTLVCYKDAALDPVSKTDPVRTTVRWVDPPVDTPQSLLTGTTYGTNATPEQQPWVVTDDTSWVLAGTGLQRGDEIPGLVGYEYDRLAGITSQPNGLAVVGLSPVRGWEGADHSASVTYTAASGAPVFNAGTIQWAWGLDDFGHEKIGRYQDARVQQMTKNILNALITGRGGG